jgi:predicted GIY-YIG superfamily endonuclease
METLRQYRTDQAYQRAIPSSAVFSDKLLKRIVLDRPSSLVSLLKISGIGPVRCQNYGRDVVRFVNLDAKIRGGRTKNKIKNSIMNTPRPPPTARNKGKPRRAPIVSSGIKKAVNRPVIKTRKTKKPARKSFITKLQANAIPQIVTSRFFPSPGSDLPVERKTAISRLLPVPKASVYVLELEDGRVYVGSSKDIPRRISQHASGAGSAYTRIYKPTGVQLPRLGNIEGDGDAAERDETLRYMMLRGIPYVRGWKFSRVDMPPEEFEEAESNIRELFDLCRRCGYKGHFCTHCRATFDRLGNPVGRQH